MKLILTAVLITILLLVSFGCGNISGGTNDNTSEQENSSENDTLDAISLIENNCSRCHNLDRVYVIKAKDQWPIIIDRMVRKSPGLLNEVETTAVVEYFQENYSQ